ncbi:MAG: hypothetical protein PGN11_09400 [Quadrisphaera sp.]
MIDAIIVNYKTPDFAARAVSAVQGPGVKVFVTDNSGDLTIVGPQASAAHIDVQCWTPGRNTFFAEGNNYWFERTSSPYILLLNPDVEISHDDVMALRRALEAHPEVWGVAPRLLNEDGTPQNYLQRLPVSSDLAVVVASSSGVFEKTESRTLGLSGFGLAYTAVC